MSDNKEYVHSAKYSLKLFCPYEPFEFMPLGKDVITITSFGDIKPPSIRVRLFCWILFGAKFKWINKEVQK